MDYLGAWILLNIILLHLVNGNPLVDRGRLLTGGNAHKDSVELVKEEGEAGHFRAFLENLKADFLRSLNLSDVPSQEKMNEEPPQFMIDLYNRYTKDKSSSPISNIVRSFSPEEIGSPDMSPLQKYILLFNVSIPRHEEVTRAELRIHFAYQEERECLSPIQGELAIYEVLGGDHWEQLKGTKSFLASKDIRECGWVMFDVSGTVRRWVSEGRSSSSSNPLKISVESRVSDDPSCENLRLSVMPDSNLLPLLIVFSNDHSNRIKGSRADRQERIAHKQESVPRTGARNHTVHTQSAGSSDGIRHPSARSKRSTEPNHCRRTSLRVNFKEIGWNWIIAPLDYEAFECKGGCFFPLTDNVTPTKHAIVQTLVHYKNPKKASKACCVPTKLDPISMLYNDDAGTPTLKYQYEGMKVAECGCR